MAQSSLLNFILAGRGEKQGLFKNPEVFSNTYIPNVLPGREKQIKMVKTMLDGCHRLNQNMVILGKRGTGKTAVIKHIMNNILPKDREIIDKREDVVSLNIDGKRGVVVYANCRIHYTKLKLLTTLANLISSKKFRFRSWQDALEFIKTINEKSGIDFMVVILDEIDVLDDKNNDIIYTFSRWNEVGSKTITSLVLISNNTLFPNMIEPRAKSSFYGLNIVFSPYNEQELIDILRNRCNYGLNDDCWDDSIIEIVAKRVARDDGDARKAIQIIRRSAEIAGYEGKDKIDYASIEKAYDYWDADAVLQVISTLPIHEKICLKAITNILKYKNYAVTGEIYDEYVEIIKEKMMIPMTQRTISEYLSDLDSLGVIHVRLISEGRYGRTKVVRNDKNIDIIRQMLEEVK